MGCGRSFHFTERIDDMRKIFKCLSPFLLAICLSVLTTVPALAAEQRFSDVPMDTPYFEAVEYPITSGRFP